MHFKRVTKSKEFCLTLVGEARLWYESLKSIALDWNGLQTQYSAVFKNRKHQRIVISCMEIISLDKNSVTLDSYVTHIRQVVVLLGSGKPQVLEPFKNTLTTRLYWVLFPIEDLRQAVETAK